MSEIKFGCIERSDYDAKVLRIGFMRIIWLVLGINNFFLFGFFEVIRGYSVNAILKYEF